ncbi:MAG: 50S ribosomal protein L5 [Verrucomicrobiales bacterium]|nr:50S ribosomal protein L5 [Verrucomicrobiales bacterium]
MNPALLTKYKEEVVTALKEHFGYKNIHEVPFVEKLVINCGVGKAESDRKQAVQDALDAIALITGQRGVATAAKTSISNFKLRAGELVGAKVTLRGARMYEFLLRLIGTAIPSIRDFRGVSAKAFDGRGNYTLGITDYTIFPEVELDKVQRALGFDVCIVTSANSDDEARELLHLLGMPFRGREKKAA